MIAFDHVTYTYEGRGQPSLRDCSFTVEPGELILLTGESGCGKTTIIKLINGLLQHGGNGKLEGTVTVAGRNIPDTPVGAGPDRGLGVPKPQVPVLQPGHHQ